jgi:hypothetical protein
MNNNALVAGLLIRIHFIRTLIQHFRLNTDPDPDPIRIQGFNDQKLKINAEKKKIFWIKNFNLSIPRPPKRTSKLQKKPSGLKRGHPTLKNMNFYNFFLLFWVIFALLDPLTRLNPDPIRIRNSGW